MTTNGARVWSHAIHYDIQENVSKCIHSEQSDFAWNNGGDILCFILYDNCASIIGQELWYQRNIKKTLTHF